MKKKISTGRVFQKSYRDRSGEPRKTATWYLKYYVRGQAVEESTGTEDYNEALAMLRRKLANAPTERASQPDRVTLGQLLDLLIEDYKFRGRKSVYDTKLRVDAHLRPFFGARMARELSPAVLREYVAYRRRQEAEAATINKELALLRRAMNIGAAEEPPLVLRVPKFTMLPVDNIREGTMDHEQYKLVRDSLPGYARIALVIAYHTGARKGEICAIQRAKVDLKAKRIELPARTTKNGRPRYLPIYGDMEGELDLAMAAVEKSKCPFLIQRDARRVFDFEKVWASACEVAGMKKALFHDLRRTALTNMIEAGLSEKEAMEISGHKTRAVFDRYHIVSEKRLQANAAKLGEHLKAKDLGASVKEAVH